MLKILFKIKKLFYAKLIFHAPEKNNILFYDNDGTKLIKKNLKKKKYDTIYIRGESINLIILLKMFLNFGFSYKAYTIQYIKYVKPKIIITCIDNNYFFYTLKKKFPGTVFIAIQNGYRTQHRDFFAELKRLKGRNKLEKLEVDYIFIFGSSIRSEYSKYIKFEPILLGSYRSNLVPIIKKSVINKSVFFISQFRQNVYTGNKNFWIENKLLPVIQDFCDKYKLKLFIGGANINNSYEEKKYFSKILSKNKWTFLKRKSLLSNFKLIDKFKFIINIDSSLGYEAASRKNKVAFFSIRKISDYEPVEMFNWPKNLRKKGFFYSSTISRKEVFRVLKNVMLISRKKWTKNYLKLFRMTVDFQPNNKKLYKIINKYT